MKGRAIFLAVVAFLWASGVAARLYYLQVERHDYYVQKAADQQRRQAARQLRVGIAEIASASLRREALTARAIVSYVAIRHHGLTLTSVARQLGVSVNSIARALQRAEKHDVELRNLRID